ncbi:MAG: ZIP family metal transporter [Coriobacteriia bacterium]|nr:ZIP family metal transporter [Coriobacteriia bacterium]
MSTLLQVLFFSMIGGAFSLFGGTLLMARQSWADRFARYATPFAAGSMLAAAFIDLLPEALESGKPQSTMFFTLLGLLFFFITETIMHWSHDHSQPEGHALGHDHLVEDIHSLEGPLTDAGKANGARGDEGLKTEKNIMDLMSNPVFLMLNIGDTIHNFLDGVAIAAGFLISPASGIIVTMAVAAHEIPSEMGDFGIMLGMGLKRSRVLLVNLASSFATTIAALVFFMWGNSSDITLTPVLSLVSGFFIYIAAVDIIPSLHDEHDKKELVKKSVSLLVGVVIVSLMIISFHSLIEV